MILLLSACQNGCPDEQQETARRDLSNAFVEWHNSLDFMDEILIEKAYLQLKSAAEEVSECIPVDTVALEGLEAVNRTYGDPHPRTDEIRRAEALVQEAAGKFRFPDAP